MFSVVTQNTTIFEQRLTTLMKERAELKKQVEFTLDSKPGYLERKNMDKFIVN
jgi:hypothetical protein